MYWFSRHEQMSMSQTKLFTIVIVQPKKANIDKMEHCQQCCVDGAIIEWSFRIKKRISAPRNTSKQHYLVI